MLALLTGAALADELSRTEQLNAFAAAGFSENASECEIEETGTYSPPTMEVVRDLNGDGRPDALITEGSVYCYGRAGAGFYLVSQHADGQWKLLASEHGHAQFLESRGADGWPDIQVAGAGACFVVLRHDGERYRTLRRMGERCGD
ncbi:hypothetical protein P0Y43_19575 [Pseudomonas entomophila]|uniref:hypothetical protein n=1 Tax=Pseudomonas entomophila TaxID=312306 RepID=UPI0023D8ADE5|nr:hypothetical protein [Pseudomonas entomophila]MDF0732895.1 hypothetical protein [Pseudomonas entomophila]